MIILLSPAKSLDFSTSDINDATQPRLMHDTDQLIKILSKKSARSLKKLMNISDSLAQENEERFKSFESNHDSNNSKPAVLAFNGDVYRGLDAASLSESDIDFAQEHVRILSGLYGFLRPKDLIQPYRLEMGTKLNNRRGKNLYKFWGNRITQLLNEDLKNTDSDLIVNLASNEYFSSINKKKLDGQLLNVNFKEYKGDDLKFISFNAKKARGLLTRFIIDSRITDKEDIKGFDTERYMYSEDHSTDDSWTFVRDFIPVTN